MKKGFVKAFVVCVIFTLTIIFNIILSNNTTLIANAEPAKKATLEETEGTMAVGSEPLSINLVNVKEDAIYTYIPADTSMISVMAQGSNALVFSTKTGKTTITVKEEYRGKTTTVGIYTVTVVHAQLENSSMEIGISRYNSLTLLYVNTNASYTYKVADPKIASVDRNGYITGLKYGKTTIAVTEKYKGKSIKIGTCNITVTKAKLAVTNLKMPIYEAAYDQVPIACKNEKATYQYSSSNPKVVMVDQYGNYSGYQEGKAKITITETLNKVTTKLGTITIQVVLSALDINAKTLVLDVDSTISEFEVFDFYAMIPILYKNYYARYTLESADTSIVSIEKDYNDANQSLIIVGTGVGKTTLEVFEEYKGKIRKLGAVEVEVREY